jgi:DNA-binding transcriptional LysR family regulator
VRRIDFVTLKLFVAIADEASLTKAAAREHLALAAVSKRISDLEMQIGSTLLYRIPKGVSLTPAGHALLHHARNLLSDVERLNADLSEFSKGVKGHIRIHANTSSIIEFLPQDLYQFQQLNPQIKIDIEEQVSTQIVRAVREGLTDIGLYAGHIDTEDLQTYSYRWDRLVLVVPREHPLAQRTSVSLKDTAGFDFIGLQQDASLHSLIQQSAHELSSPMRIRIQVRSFEAISRMIDTGMGIGILPEGAVRLYQSNLNIVTVPINDDWAHRELKLCVRDYNALSVIARQMVDHLIAPGQQTPAH